MTSVIPVHCAVPTELSSHLGAGHNISIKLIVKIHVNMLKIISLNCGERYEDMTIAVK